MSGSPIDVIRSRHDSLSARERKLQTQIEAVREELAELSVALKVLDRFTPPTETEGQVQVSASTTLKMPDLILLALKSDSTGEGMLPQDVAAVIQSKWNVNADSNHVRPGLWRLHQNKRIGKSGDKYHLHWIEHTDSARTNEDPETSSGSSEAFAEELLGGNPDDPHVSTANPGSGD